MYIRLHFLPEEELLRQIKQSVRIKQNKRKGRSGVRKVNAASFLWGDGILYNYVAKIENSSRKSKQDVI